MLECLVRFGVKKISVIDFDTVDITNLNRQIISNTDNIGQLKTDVAVSRALSINPQCDIKGYNMFLSAENMDFIGTLKPDYVIDAIDSLSDKAALIRAACASGATFFSSMGAARKIDPTRIHVTNFWKVRDCPLGAALRKKLRREGGMPEHSFLAVYGDEVLDGDKGSLVHITSIFGMTLAGLVIKDIYAKNL